jgi:hypothetical protein
MAKEHAQKSSLDASIEAAKRVGASVDETRRIHSLVSANTTSDIRSFEVTFGRDSADHLAVWVNLFVDKDLPPSPEKIADLDRATTTIRSELLKANIAFWPYVVIREFHEAS